jgi:mannose-6-phosphate isomerase-like protein (cupin superfamily)
MKQPFFKVYLALIILISVSASKAINSGVFEWLKPTGSGTMRNILMGPTRSLDKFEIKAVTLKSGQGIKEYKVKPGCDELLIIKEGTADISVNGESKTIGEGSLVVVSQGDRIKIRNAQKKELAFFSFLFKPKYPVASTQSVKVSPLIKDWTNIEFKPSANGGRRDIMRQPLSALKELEIHTTTLNEGLPSHNAHTHPDEEIILVRFGNVEETINGKPYPAGPGSVIFLTNDDNHGIRNIGKGSCEYYAIRWLTRLPESATLDKTAK